MNITLLVEGNLKIESFYTLNLAVWLGLETVTSRNVDGALKYIDTKASGLNLIIVRAHIGKEEAARLLIDTLAEKKLKIPVIVVGPGNEVPGSFAHLTNSLQLKNLIQNSAKALSITAKDMNEKAVPDFFPIPLAYFKVIKRAICPVYSQDPNDSTIYNLRVDKLKAFDEAFLQNLEREGVKKLYVDKLDRLEFVNNITSELMSQLEKEEVSEDEHFTASEKSVELLSKKLVAIGVNDETIDLAKKNIATLKQNIKSYPKLASLLQRLLSNKSSYAYKHTQILTFVCLHMVKKMDWGSADQEEKITFISFFHDIALESDAHASIKSTRELNNAKLTLEEKQLVEKHAQIAAEFIQKFPKAPMGADQIIRQHHGTLNGIGFSENYGANISPVAVVFAVAEEFTRIILNRGNGPFDRVQMIRELKEEFPNARFQKVIDVLSDLGI